MSSRDEALDPYHELQLSPDAEPELIKAAFKALAKKYHPDAYPDGAGKARAEEKMRRINEAQRLLLSGNYHPPARRAVTQMAPSQPAPRAAASPSSNRNKTNVRTSERAVPTLPVVIAVALLMLAFAWPQIWGKNHLAQAEALARSQKWTQALEQANLAVADDPRDGASYLMRAQIWSALGEKQKAETDLANARGLVTSMDYANAEKRLQPSSSPSASPATPTATPTR